MKKNSLLATIILCAILATSCGSGMIGLFEKNIAGKKFFIMDNYIFTVENGCEYEIEVYEYFEPNYECGNDNIEDVFYKDLIVEKKCGNWTESTILEDGYINLVAQSLHEEYLNLICGE